jgi:EmrB/QacA subfamily drug resistance transporter
MLAPMLGPLFGGFLVDAVSWRWIFYVNVPVGALSFVFSWLVLKEHREPGAGKFDPIGFVLAGFGTASALFAFSRGPDDGWTSPIVLATGFGGITCLALLVYFETHNPAPMLDLSLYASRLFRTANLTGAMFMCAQFGMLFVLPLFLQQLLGLSAFESGLTTFPQPVGQIIMVQFTSRMYHRLGPRVNLLIGTGGILLTTLLFLLVNLDTGLWWIRGLVFLRGCFIAFNMVAMQTAAFSAVPRAKTGRASSLFSTLRQVGAAFGVAAVGTVLTSQVHDLNLATDPAAAAQGLVAFHTCLVVLLALNALGVVFASRIQDGDAGLAPRRVKSRAAAASGAAD